jgi:hypothetical protein
MSNRILPEVILPEVMKRPRAFVDAVKRWMASRETAGVDELHTEWDRLLREHSPAVMASAMIDVLEGRIP